MWTSTTLLMLSKWMSQTCSMMSERVQRPVAVAHQELEQRVLLRLEVDGTPGAAHRAPDGVELEVGHPQHVLARSAAPQQRAQTRRQLRQRERLDHVVVSAGVEAGHPLVDGVLRA